MPGTNELTSTRPSTDNGNAVLRWPFNNTKVALPPKPRISTVPPPRRPSCGPPSQPGTIPAPVPELLGRKRKMSTRRPVGASSSRSERDNTSIGDPT